RRRLVDLDPFGAGGGEGLELGVDGGHQVPAERQAVIVVRVAGPRLDVNGERHRSRAGRLDGLVGLGPEIAEFLDRAQPLRHHDLRDGAVAGHAVVGVEPGLPAGLELFQAVHLAVEGLHEEETAHLAVAKHVDARTLLIADGELGGVVEGFPSVGLPVLARLDLVERRPEPAGESVTSHHVGVEQGQRAGHVGSFRRVREAERRVLLGTRGQESSIAPERKSRSDRPAGWLAPARARILAVARTSTMRLDPPIPVLRSFDWALARRFYVDWLGFAVDWEHRTGS